MPIYKPKIRFGQLGIGFNNYKSNSENFGMDKSNGLFLNYKNAIPLIDPNKTSELNLNLVGEKSFNRNIPNTLSAGVNVIGPITHYKRNGSYLAGEAEINTGMRFNNNFIQPMGELTGGVRFINNKNNKERFSIGANFGGGYNPDLKNSDGGKWGGNIDVNYNINDYISLFGKASSMGGDDTKEILRDNGQLYPNTGSISGTTLTGGIKFKLPDKYTLDNFKFKKRLNYPNTRGGQYTNTRFLSKD